MDRLTGGKAGPDLLLPAPPYHFMSLFLAPQARVRVLSQRHFTASVGGSAGPGLDRGIPHTPRQKVLRVFPVSSCGKPVGKGQNERKMLPSAVTEEDPSLPIEKKGLFLLGIINQWV